MYKIIISLLLYYCYIIFVLLYLFFIVMGGKKKHSTPMKASSFKVNDQSDNNINEVKLLKQEISEMKLRMELLEQEIIRLKSDQAISSRVNDCLRDSIDVLEQYSKRSCVIIKDVPVAGNEGSTATARKVVKIMEDSGISQEVINDIDKLHPVSAVQRNNQKFIIKFKSHSKWYELFRKRKQLKSNLRVSSALTKRR